MLDDAQPSLAGAGDDFQQPRTMAAVLGALFLAGAAIGAVSLVLPHPSAFDSRALWSNVAIASAGSALLLLARNRLSVWSLQLAVLAATAIVTRAVYHGHDPSGYYTIWYLWIGVYAFFFFSLRWGIFQVGALGLAYAWLLTELPGPTPVVRWVVTVGSILVAGLLVDALAGRLRRETISSSRRAANLEAVGEVARQLATQSDSRAVGWAICSAAMRTAHASAAVLWRPTQSGDALHGGEEFAVAFPGTDLARAQKLLDRLRAALPEGQTCSVGVCQWDRLESAEQLTARADTALYAAKAAGRDRIIAT